MTPFDTAYKYYAVCGVDPQTIPIITTANYQMLWDRFLPSEMLRQVLYTMNMVNSELVPKLDCLGVVFNPYWGLFL